jgi:hypothetical protein
MTLRKFSTAHELLDHYREVRTRTKAWGPPPAPPPPPPPPPSAAPPPVRIAMTPWGRIMQAVAQEFQVSLVVIRSRIRLQHVVLSRQVVALLAAELTNISDTRIARLLHRDHSTVVCAIVSVRHKIARNPALAAKVQRVRDQLLEKNEYDDSSRGTKGGTDEIVCRHP